MSKMKNSIENQFIEHLVRTLPRSGEQMNALQEADAEIIRTGHEGLLLALTMDSIAEEIESGLYSDPFLMGWMTVLVNASDLAAVGAQPLGILVNETLGPEADDAFLEQLQQGIAGAARACALPVLGGDTNFAGHTELSGCAVGILENNSYLKRTGCQAGDLLYASGPLGLGNAFAFQQLQNQPPSVSYQPQPRFAQSALIRAFASCCMDTSDGLLTTLDQLMRLNGLGFEVNSAMAHYLHPQALELCQNHALPLTTVLAAPHGEFELIFTIPPEQNKRFLTKAQQINWQPIQLGTVTEKAGLRLRTEKGIVKPDTTAIRNLFDEHHGDISGYVRHLIEYIKQL